ncbi:hypothetical protein HHE02_16390 [Helicobacter heilmannii]|nr:hypothetical protein HHE02_16390 [Helicobacter heilmannii]
MRENFACNFSTFLFRFFSVSLALGFGFYVCPIFLSYCVG